MIKFQIVSRDNPINEDDRNIVHLHKLTWNDWFVFATLYELDYVDEKGESHNIGSTKIGRVGMKGASYDSDNKKDRHPSPPKNFVQLENNFFSLGQDASFYKNLKKLEGNVRGEILEKINDIAFSEHFYNLAIDEEVTKVALLRGVSISSVTGQFKRLSQGAERYINYSFKYQSRKRPKSTPYIMSFEVDPRSNPPTNVQVIIGRNGVGKTSVLNDMISSLIKEDGETNRTDFGHFEIETSESLDNTGFANLVSVSFSAFDDSEPLGKLKDMTQRIKYSYIGLKSAKKKGESKSTYVLEGEFWRSLLACIKLSKLDLWKRSVTMLESDPIFNDSNVMKLSELDIKDEKGFERECRKIFSRFSSGHRVVLLTMTKLVETIEEKSLVLLDEPEAHLHPPLLSAFVRALSDIMTIRNGVAIMATHSPVVLQEVPKSCVWILNRTGAEASAERLKHETFGENVGVLTKKVFGLEITHSGFHKLISKSVEESNSLEEVLEDFNNELGMEGQAIAQTLLIQKRKR